MDKIKLDKNLFEVMEKITKEGRYDVSIEKEYSEEDEPFIKQLTFEEILNKFPRLWPFAQKNK